MRIAYFDCFAGASGDMILGALFDAGLDLQRFRKEISSLKMEGFQIDVKQAVRKGISGSKFTVEVTKDQEERHLADIIGIIEHSRLSKDVKQRANLIFQRLAEAEAVIHGKSVEAVHFHEVGAVDSIIDIVGTVMGLEMLGVERVHASRIHVGTGFLECAHGTLPVPPPATLHLLKGLPVVSRGIQSELVAPTGAAILSTLADGFGELPTMRVEEYGYGFGTKDLPIANFIRVLIGVSETTEDEDAVQVIETNIDDMNPQFYDHIMQLLFSEGAKDVFMTPIIMKKNRPGVILSVIASPTDSDRLTEIVLRETTTLGVRISGMKTRKIVAREIIHVTTPLGEARVKVRGRDGLSPVYTPEYDDCKRLAQEHRKPIQEIYDLVRKAAAEGDGSQ